MNKITSIIIAVMVIGTTFFFVNKYPAPTITETGGGQKELTKETNNSSGENIEIKKGIQYITIIARGGYSPRISNAMAGIPTKLIIKTNGTFDCSAALVIRSLNYRDMLPNTGETIIDAGTPKSGEKLQGICGMGMYNFLVSFS